MNWERNLDNRIVDDRFINEKDELMQIDSGVFEIEEIEKRFYLFYDKRFISSFEKIETAKQCADLIAFG